MMTRVIKIHVALFAKHLERSNVEVWAKISSYFKHVAGEKNVLPDYPFLSKFNINITRKLTK